MLKCLFLHKIVVYLHRVFHSIRFKVNRVAAATHFLFIYSFLFNQTPIINEFCTFTSLVDQNRLFSSTITCNFVLANRLIADKRVKK